MRQKTVVDPRKAKYDFKHLAGMARRLRRCLPRGWIAQLAGDEREEAQRPFLATRTELHALIKRCD